MYYRFSDGTELKFDWERAQDDPVYGRQISKLIRIRQNMITKRFEDEAKQLAAEWDAECDE